MCGICDYPFRAVLRANGAEFTYTQMVSSEAIWRGDRKSLDILDFQPPEPLVAMQLFGGKPEALVCATHALEEKGAAFLDINMGCPARKITSANAGSALLRDLPLIRKIFQAMRAATGLPLSVKMRWDWEGDTQGDGVALEVARMAEGEGLDAVCLHARTRSQGYAGVANWELIARMKEAVSIPVIGNGDIRCPADALEMMRQSGCDGVMIGRALIGDPWLLRDCLEAIRRGEAGAERTGSTWPERREMMLQHALAMHERRGRRGLIQFRKHAAGYLRGLRGAKKMRERLNQVDTLDQLREALNVEALVE